jgi:gas vesicle protein
MYGYVNGIGRLKLMATNSSNTMKTSLIFLLGLGLGTVLGILIAPEAGRITRRKVREEADRMIDKALAKKQLKELERTSPDVSVIKEEERYTI